MKTKIITNLAKEVLLVELPPKSECIKIGTGYSIDSEDGTGRFIKAKLVGKLSDLKSEDVEGLVEKVMGGQHCQNYNVRANGVHKGLGSLWVKDALESFFSALEAEGINLNGNPYEKYSYAKDDTPVYDLFLVAEKRTFDKSRTLVLVKN